MISPATPPLFYALPADTPNPPPDTEPLYEYLNEGTGEHAYSTDPLLGLPGFTLAADPVALVWENPLKVDLPVISSTSRPLTGRALPSSGNGCRAPGRWYLFMVWR